MHERKGPHGREYKHNAAQEEINRLLVQPISGQQGFINLMAEVGRLQDRLDPNAIINLVMQHRAVQRALNLTPEQKEIQEILTNCVCTECTDKDCDKTDCVFKTNPRKLSNFFEIFSTKSDGKTIIRQHARAITQYINQHYDIYQKQHLEKAVREYEEQQLERDIRDDLLKQVKKENQSFSEEQQGQAVESAWQTLCQSDQQLQQYKNRFKRQFQSDFRGTIEHALWMQLYNELMEMAKNNLTGKHRIVMMQILLDLSHLSQYYDIQATPQGIQIIGNTLYDEKPEGDKQTIEKKLITMISKHRHGTHIVLFDPSAIIEGKLARSWKLISAPTDDDVFQAFLPTLKAKEYATLYSYIEEVRPLLSTASLLESQIGETYRGPLTCSVTKIPVSFPDAPVDGEFYDLCGEILRFVPDEQGRIQNPFTRQYCYIHQLRPRQDIANILTDRIHAQENPQLFMHQLFQQQQEEKGGNANLAEPIKNRLQALKEAQHRKLAAHILSDENIPFINLVRTDPTISLEIKKIQTTLSNEFRARYGILCCQVESKKDCKIFSVTNDEYQAWLQQYENKSLLPVNFIRVGDLWQATLTKAEYEQMVTDNKETVTHLLASFKKYQEHLQPSVSEFKSSGLATKFQRNVLMPCKKKVLIQTKNNETQSLIDNLTAKNKPDAEKLIDFRENLPKVAKQLNARRDEWPWWLMKVTVTGLTLGMAHFVCKIWQVEGRELMNDITNQLRPTFH